MNVGLTAFVIALKCTHMTLLSTSDKELKAAFTLCATRRYAMRFDHCCYIMYIAQEEKRPQKKGLQNSEKADLHLTY